MQNTIQKTESTLPRCEAKKDEEGWYGVLERLKNQIAWIEYVPEHELTPSESKQLCRACERLIPVIQKLNRKYVD